MPFDLGLERRHVFLCHCLARLMHIMYKLLDVESQLRPGLAFMTMFFQLVLIGLMLLYLFRGRMPVSYRIWSAVNGMSLLIYN